MFHDASTVIDDRFHNSWTDQPLRDSKTWTGLSVLRFPPNWPHVEFALQNMAQSVRYGRPVLFVTWVTLSGRFLVRIRFNWFVLPVYSCPASILPFCVTMGGLKVKNGFLIVQLAQGKKQPILLPNNLRPKPVLNKLFCRTPTRMLRSCWLLRRS